MICGGNTTEISSIDKNYNKNQLQEVTWKIELEQLERLSFEICPMITHTIDSYQIPFTLSQNGSLSLQVKTYIVHIHKSNKTYVRGDTKYIFIKFKSSSIKYGFLDVKKVQILNQVIMRIFNDVQ